MELDGIPAYALGGKRLGSWFEHGQRAGSRFRRLTRIASGLGPLFFAQGARTCVAKKCKWVVRRVAVLPLDVHSGPGCQVDFDRLGISRGSHESSIAQVSTRGSWLPAISNFRWKFCWKLAASSFHPLKSRGNYSAPGRSAMAGGAGFFASGVGIATGVTMRGSGR